MKVVWADLKNQNKYSFINKKKHEDGVTLTVKLGCDKDSSSSRIQWTFFWKWSVYLSRTSAVASDFNHQSEDYINYISTDFSVEMMSTQNDSQSSGR